MKYIIAGKNIAKGVLGNDSADLGTYFELGWEVVGSRLDAIRLLKTGKIINFDTTIVTIEDRIFMYSAFYDNVISWQEFLRRHKSGEIFPTDSVSDWTVERNFSFLNLDKKCEFWENLDPSPTSNSRYARHDEDYDLITDGFVTNKEYLNDACNEMFYVANIRLRDHCSNRSSPESWWKLLLTELSSQKSRNIYLVGQGAEKFVLDNRMHHVSKLQDYVTLIQDPRCADVISTATGTCLLAYAASKSPVHLIDHSNVSYVNQNNAVMGGVCSQFLKSPIYRYNSDDITSLGIEKILKRLR
jgi:hypothetical protein